MCAINLYIFIHCQPTCGVEASYLEHSLLDSVRFDELVARKVIDESLVGGARAPPSHVDGSLRYANARRPCTEGWTANAGKLCLERQLDRQ